MAMLILHEQRAWAFAGQAWQTSVIVPQSFIRRSRKVALETAHGSNPADNQDQIFFIIASAIYAARVCPAEFVSSNVIAMDMRVPWKWLVITEIKEPTVGGAARLVIEIIILWLAHRPSK